MGSHSHSCNIEMSRRSCRCRFKYSLTFVLLLSLLSDVEVRMCVIGELSNGDRPTLSHLAQPELLELLRLCLRDENLEMQVCFMQFSLYSSILASNRFLNGQNWLD